MIGKISPALLGSDGQISGSDVNKKQEIDFKDTLKEALTGINDLQQNAADSTELFVRGELTDLHQVMLEAQKAKIGMELMLEIRNKLIEGYQEIMRMQM